IIANAPGVKLLVTSREKLNLQGEWVLSLQGLPITEGDSTENAVALFIQRAKMARSDFTSSKRDLPTIGPISQLVGRRPLGIELAAAGVQLLSCAEIAEGIAHNLSFLSSTSRDRPERHQSFRRVFEHSWKLLSSEQQQLFTALSVFRGGFQADAALEVA